jgi:hypothetical protein
MSTDDDVNEIPRWHVIRATTINNAIWNEGAVYLGDPGRARLSDLEPLNISARRWPTSRDAVAHRPRYVNATERLLLIDGKIVHPGQAFFSDGWPEAEAWRPINKSAETVTAYAMEHPGKLPSRAWVDDALNTSERDEEHRHPKPKPWVDTRSEWPFGNAMPPSAKGFRPRDPR